MDVNIYGIESRNRHPAPVLQVLAQPALNINQTIEKITNVY